MIIVLTQVRKLRPGEAHGVSHAHRDTSGATEIWSPAHLWVTAQPPHLGSEHIYSHLFFLKVLLVLFCFLY